MNSYSLTSGNLLAHKVYRLTVVTSVGFLVPTSVGFIGAVIPCVGCAMSCGVGEVIECCVSDVSVFASAKNPKSTPNCNGRLAHILSAQNTYSLLMDLIPVVCD